MGTRTYSRRGVLTAAGRAREAQRAAATAPVTPVAPVDTTPRSLALEREMYDMSNYDLSEAGRMANRNEDYLKAWIAYTQLGQNEYNRLPGANNPVNMYGISENDTPMDVINDIAAHAAEAFEEFLNVTNSDNVTKETARLARYFADELPDVIKEIQRFIKDARTVEDKEAANLVAQIYVRNIVRDTDNQEILSILNRLNDALEEAERYYKDRSGYTEE